MLTKGALCDFLTHIALDGGYFYTHVLAYSQNAIACMCALDAWGKLILLFYSGRFYT